MALAIIVSVEQGVGVGFNIIVWHDDLASLAVWQAVASKRINPREVSPEKIIGELRANGYNEGKGRGDYGVSVDPKRVADAYEALIGVAETRRDFCYRLVEELFDSIDASSLRIKADAIAVTEASASEMVLRNSNASDESDRLRDTHIKQFRSYLLRMRGFTKTVADRHCEALEKMADNCHVESPRNIGRADYAIWERGSGRPTRQAGLSALELFVKWWNIEHPDDPMQNPTERHG